MEIDRSREKWTQRGKARKHEEQEDEKKREEIQRERERDCLHEK